MGTRVAVAIAMVAAIVGGGYLLYGALFEDDNTATPAPAPADAAAVAVAPPPDAAPSAPSVVVTSVEGTVERRTGEHTWEPIAAGAALSPDDVLRTGDDGAVAIAVGDAEVRMDPNTQIAVPAITETVAGVRLGQGRIAANVPGDSGRVFGVNVDGSDAVAETSSGEFAVLTSGDGEAIVAATRGTVRVTAKQKTVEVTAGELSVVERGAPPSAPKAIPSSLFLKVKRPGKKQRSKKYTVRGKTAPGAVIRVNGVPVRVDASGAFSEVIALEEGKNDVAIESRDVGGRREKQRVEVVVDSTGPRVGGDVKWGNP